CVLLAPAGQLLEPPGVVAVGAGQVGRKAGYRLDPVTLDEAAQLGPSHRRRERPFVERCPVAVLATLARTGQIALLVQSHEDGHDGRVGQGRSGARVQCLARLADRRRPRTPEVLHHPTFERPQDVAFHFPPWFVGADPTTGSVAVGPGCRRSKGEAGNVVAAPDQKGQDTRPARRPNEFDATRTPTPTMSSPDPTWNAR